MAKIISYEGKFLPKIEGYVIYSLHGDLIIRAQSGFTSKALKENSKYEFCRMNASEFGRVSSTCKQVRLALKIYLPKKNNLQLVNGFTKKMREVMTCDAVNGKGDRLLSNALATAVGCNLLQGYPFNPTALCALVYEIEPLQVAIATKNIVFAEGATFLSFRLLHVVFDFKTFDYQITEGGMFFFSKEKLAETVSLPVVEGTAFNGTSFLLLEMLFYKATFDSLVGFEDDSCNQVFVLRCG